MLRRWTAMSETVRLCISNSTDKNRRNTGMAYDEETLLPLHNLTKSGKETYELILKERADQILEQFQYPMKSIISSICRIFGVNAHADQ